MFKHAVGVVVSLCISSPSIAAARVDAPLKIAIVQSKSKELKPLNKEFKEGVIIAMEQAAKAIPKLSKLITVHEINSGTTVKQLQNATKRAILNYRSHVIIGGFFHNDNRYIAKEAGKWKKLFVAPLYRTEDIKSVNPYAFSASKSYYQLGEAAASFMHGKLRQRKVLILNETDNPAQKEMSEGFTKKFQSLGGKISSTISYDWDESSYEGVFEKLRINGSEYAYFPGYTKQSWEIIDNLASHGIKTSFVGSQLWDQPEFLKAMSEHQLQGHYYYAIYSQNAPFKKIQAFNRIFKERNNTEANFLNYLGYETMSMVLETYIAANDNRAKPLANAMATTTFKKGLIGKYKMNKKHFPTYESSFNIITRTGTEFMTRVKN